MEAYTAGLISLDDALNTLLAQITPLATAKACCYPPPWGALPLRR